MEENEIARGVVECAFVIHRKLGPGLLESVYESIIAHELAKAGHVVKIQEPIPLLWDGLAMKECFRADLIVDDKVLVELKSVERVHPVHKKQVITYLKITGIKLGILINFGAPILTQGIERVVNDL